jgi:hypothetical protein
MQFHVPLLTTIHLSKNCFPGSASNRAVHVCQLAGQPAASRPGMADQIQRRVQHHRRSARLWNPRIFGPRHQSTIHHDSPVVRHANNSSHRPTGLTLLALPALASCNGVTHGATTPAELRAEVEVIVAASASRIFPGDPTNAVCLVPALGQLVQFDPSRLDNPSLGRRSINSARRRSPMVRARIIGRADVLGRAEVRFDTRCRAVHRIKASRVQFMDDSAYVAINVSDNCSSISILLEMRLRNGSWRPSRQVPLWVSSDVTCPHLGEPQISPHTFRIARSQNRERA